MELVIGENCEETCYKAEDIRKRGKDDEDSHGKNGEW